MSISNAFSPQFSEPNEQNNKCLLGIFSNDDVVRVNHIDYGYMSNELAMNIGCLAQKYADIEPLLTFVSLVNVIPATNRHWNESDVKNIYNFISKMNDQFMLVITPRHKIGNLYLAVGMNVINVENGFAYSLVEHMINWNVGRTDETNLREFIDFLSELHIINNSTRIFLKRSANKAVTRVHHYAYGGPGRQIKKDQQVDEATDEAIDEDGEQKQEQTVLEFDENVVDQIDSIQE